MFRSLAGLFWSHDFSGTTSAPSTNGPSQKSQPLGPTLHMVMGLQPRTAARSRPTDSYSLHPNSRPLAWMEDSSSSNGCWPTARSSTAASPCSAPPVQLSPKILGKLGLNPAETALHWFKTGIIPPEHRRYQDRAWPGFMGKPYYTF
ncbi:uncharacterized protein LOC113462427 [Phoenix dactylifera]|uniref:Uncharacterized protein LOC113462427 n=1 Tax=Phoenix dactylifera TaxID=42345 RepID=A0A8B9AB23_PHODC|nr:uncharacterized protein LOC113462427 [Phoenix dactylifera]